MMTGANPGYRRPCVMASREIYLEFQRVGPVVKVTAVDPESLVEVSIQGPANWGEEALKRTALSKLRYVLERRGGPIEKNAAPEARRGVADHPSAGRIA